MPAPWKMPTSGGSSLAERWARTLSLLSAIVNYCSDDDVACLLLIIIMFCIGGDVRASLFDGFRCDCIKIFLHPLFLEFVYRTAQWWVYHCLSSFEKKTHFWSPGRCINMKSHPFRTSGAMVRTATS